MYVDESMLDAIGIQSRPESAWLTYTGRFVAFKLRETKARSERVSVRMKFLLSNFVSSH